MDKKESNKYWTDKKLELEALKYRSRGEFYKKSVSAYMTAAKKRILDEICRHMITLKHKWADEELALEASKYDTRSDFIKCNRNAYMVAYRRDLLDRICSHMSYMRIQWTDEMLRLEALKYNNRQDFIVGNCNAYYTALNRNILDKICSHMEYQIHYWTNKELYQEALKYKTRGEFQKCHVAAYTAAHKRRILDNICGHMKKSCGISKEEKELLSEILKFYPEAVKLRKTKINIKERDYIKGFDADIFVPSLKKAIEFDGTYYHSFEVMKKGKGRSKWPVEELKNYHQIKDEYFLSIGIQILHIKEEDWKKDKESCIRKCLDFLRGENVEQAT